MLVTLEQEPKKSFEPKIAQLSSCHVFAGQLIGPLRVKLIVMARFSAVGEAFETDDALECFGRLFVALLDEIMQVVDDVIDPSHTVLRTLPLNWSIPCRYG